MDKVNGAFQFDEWEAHDFPSCEKLIEKEDVVHLYPVRSKSESHALSHKISETNDTHHQVDCLQKHQNFLHKGDTLAENVGFQEQQSGEDGNGVLVESGSSWRKLTVQRTLNESARDRVKMSSAEAERQQKSRKAIILDHGNPVVKNQTKPVVNTSNDWNEDAQKCPPDPAAWTPSRTHLSIKQQMRKTMEAIYLGI